VLALFPVSTQLLAKDIMSRTGVDDRVTPIVSFSLMFQSPRGKYNLDLFANYVKMHSNTFQYKIQYKSITNMFLFDNPRESSRFFVIGLNPPVRQGRTAYPFLLVAFNTEDFLEEMLNIDEQTCKEVRQASDREHESSSRSQHY
jgi:structure-specific recognition protein 1